MARKRSLDIEGLLFDTELVKTLTLKGLLLYEVMWGQAEDWGGLKLNSADLQLRMGAIKISIKEIDKEIKKLISKEKIIIYEVKNKTYGWIKNFTKHQKLDKPRPPTLPLPEWITYKTEKYPSGRKYAVYTITAEKLVGLSEKVRLNCKDCIDTNTDTDTDTDTTTMSEQVEFLKRWNAKMPFKHMELSDKRKEHLQARLKEPRFIDNFDLIMSKISESPFLLGKKPTEKHPNFKADFDWIIRNNDNYVKILEGKYEKSRKYFF